MVGPFNELKLTHNIIQFNNNSYKLLQQPDLSHEEVIAFFFPPGHPLTQPTLEMRFLALVLLISILAALCAARTYPARSSSAC